MSTAIDLVENGHVPDWITRLGIRRLLKQRLKQEKQKYKNANALENLISQMNEKLHTGLLVINTIVAICPMIGLLGTVTGMVGVFEIMAISGTGNARLSIF